MREERVRRRWFRGAIAAATILAYCMTLAVTVTDDGSSAGWDASAWIWRFAVCVPVTVLCFWYASTPATGQPSSRGIRATRALLVFVFLLPLQYVLATGPVVALDAAGYLPAGFKEGFVSAYTALPRTSPARRLIEDYVGLWTD